MANAMKLTKPRIRYQMLSAGIAEDRIERALYVYEKNYAIYDLNVVSEIVYRLEVKDKLQHFEQSGSTLFETAAAAKEALESMDLGTVYINMAMQQYELERDHLHYDLKAMMEIIMGLRVLYPPQNNLTSLRPEKQQQLLPVSQSPSMIDANRSQTASVRNGMGNGMGNKARSASGSAAPPEDSKESESANINAIGAPFIVESPEQRPPSAEPPRNSMMPLPESVIDGALSAHRQQQHRHQQRPQQPSSRRRARGASKGSASDRKWDGDPVMDSVVDSMIAIEHQQNQNVRSMLPQIQNQGQLQHQRSALEQLENDLISSERAYNGQLKVLLDDLIMAMFRAKYVSNEYLNAMRSSIPEMINLHSDFLTDLNTASNSKHESVVDVFCAFLVLRGDDLKRIYFKYLKDYKDILDLLGTTFHGKALLDQFIKKKAAENMDILSYLRYPFVRMSGYMMLLNSKEFKQFAVDQDAANSAKLLIADLVDALDAQQNALEHHRQCLAIQHSLSNLHYPIVDFELNRKYRGYFVFTEHDQRRGTRHDRQFYVFNDFVLIANLKNRCLSALDIRHIDIKADPAAADGSQTFKLITGKTKPLHFWVRSGAKLSSFSEMVEMGRYETWAQDALNEDRVGSGGSSIRNQLARQLNSIL